MSCILPNSNFLAQLDKIRSIPGKLGLRSTTVSVLKRTWSGERVGDGTSTDVTLNLTADGYAPQFQKLSSGEVFTSNNLYQSGDWKLILTPEYATGGYANDDLCVTADNQELFFIVNDTGFAANTIMAKVDQDLSSPMRIQIILRRTGQTL